MVALGKDNFAECFVVARGKLIFFLLASKPFVLSSYSTWYSMLKFG
jgi:hypothetical protein